MGGSLSVGIQASTVQIGQRIQHTLAQHSLKLLIRYKHLLRIIGAYISIVLSVLCLSSCSHDQSTTDAGYSAQFGRPAQAEQMQQPTQAPHMQPLQPGQPRQKPERSISRVPAVMGGQPGSTLPFSQPFRLGSEEYQFMAARGKNYVGLDARPAMQPSEGNSYFLVRYQVIHHGGGTLTIPNAAAVHLMYLPNQQVIDIDQAATNANVQSGAATGMPDQLVLEPERPQIQTLAFQVPNTVDPTQLAVLVTDPANAKRVCQIVSLSN